MNTFTTDARSDSIRLVQRGDSAALINLISAIGLFPPAEIDELEELITEYLNGRVSREFWIVDDDPELGLSSVAYCAAERMTEGTWNLYLIGVHLQRRGQGRGRRLLQRTETMVRERGGRILIVETSGTAGFEETRAFYGKCGYTQEARIRDFYREGDDKVVFWKALR